MAKHRGAEQGTCSLGDSVVACDVFLAHGEEHEALRPRSSHRRNGDFSTACRQTSRAYAFSPPESSSTPLAAAVLNLEINWHRACGDGRLTLGACVHRGNGSAGGWCCCAPVDALPRCRAEMFEIPRRGVIGLSCALYVGSTMVIVIKQNNSRQSRGSWGTILCLASSCPDAPVGADTALRARRR